MSPWLEHRLEETPGRLETARPGLARFAERWSPLVSAALVVLLAVGTVVGFRALPDGSSDHGAAPAAGGPNQLASRSTPVIEIQTDCPVEPRTVDEVMRVLTQPVPFRTNQPSGKQADAATVEAITATQRAWLPCRMTRSPLHSWALVSDHYLQEELFGIYSTGLNFRDVRAGLTEAAAEGMDISYTWDPDIPADSYFPVIQPDQVVVLKDGRVVATVLWMNTSGEPADRNIPLSGIAFVQERGEWVIDEFTFGAG